MRPSVSNGFFPFPATQLKKSLFLASDFFLTVGLSEQAGKSLSRDSRKSESLE